ncbi:mitochondrial carrier [Pseudovirgaria hyperparasitica]|uniref:Mitochondrial carrier n=1 Tax=Pseudovirgaria hyperparasitica TaxID=470096 RepID=A0A6A6WCB2_9PEZI|nr:mitochondrial carrier [Pseudovirgaria hyperparasitica]KAF2759486.1 mitochondrial carrier [Pseudovirgaria hyperparasitica]
MPETRDDGQLPKPQSEKERAHQISRRLLLTHQGFKVAKEYRTEIAASSSSLLSTLAAYPLDSVKTRMQAYKFSSFADCVEHTYRSEGLHGFWRGVWSPLASITLVRTVSFSIYQKAKYTYDSWIFRSTGQSPLVVANTKNAMPTLATMACFGAAGATAGCVISFIACPFELTKLSAQIAVLMSKGNGRGEATAKETARGKSYEQLGTWKTAKQIVKYRGFAGLYSGFHLHTLRDTIGTGIYFMTYESAKQVLANARGNSPTSPAAVVVAGGLCGLVSWACIYPIDSAKSIYQRNCLTSDKKDTKRPKVQFFNPRMYRGLTVSMTRSCIVNAVFFSAFEMTKKYINHFEYDEDIIRRGLEQQEELASRK